MTGRRDHIVSARFTATERHRLGRLAAEAGCTPSEFLRRSALPPPATPIGTAATSGISPGHAVVSPTLFSAGVAGVVWHDGSVGATFTAGAS